MHQGDLCNRGVAKISFLQNFGASMNLFTKGPVRAHLIGLGEAGFNDARTATKDSAFLCAGLSFFKTHLCRRL